MWASAGRGDSKLPQFWKDALTALRERPLVAQIPGSFTVVSRRSEMPTALEHSTVDVSNYL